MIAAEERYAAGYITHIKLFHSWETTNPIFGPTVNPHDHTRGVGGSSGGEAALLAAGGSILGFGSDIGGSLRIPAHMTGICSFKPTETRIRWVEIARDIFADRCFSIVAKVVFPYRRAKMPVSFVLLQFKIIGCLQD